MRIEPLFTLTGVIRPQEIGATPDGSRMNVEVEGDTDPGDRVRGHVKGVAYLIANQEGVASINFQGTLTTADGDVAALSTMGRVIMKPDGTATGREALIFQTAASKLAWLNRVVGFVMGKGDMNKGELKLSAYTLED